MINNLYLAGFFTILFGVLLLVIDTGKRAVKVRPSNEKVSPTSLSPLPNRKRP